MARLMTGESGGLPGARRAPRPAAPARLHIRLDNTPESPDIVVHPGEIVGLSGLADSGAGEIVRSAYGAHRHPACRIEFGKGTPAARTPRQAVKAGIAYVPHDRLDEAVYADLSVRENLLLPRAGRYWRHGRFQTRREQNDALDLMRRYAVRALGQEAPVLTLSGGNQQKIVIARALSTNPLVLLLEEPTQGVDVGARADIHAAVRAAADNGTSVLVASTDFQELGGLCDRIILLNQGRFLAELPGGTPAHSILDTLYSSLEATNP
jgi:ribose transport system ATP-binding protein